MDNNMQITNDDGNISCYRLVEFKIDRMKNEFIDEINLVLITQSTTIQYNIKSDFTFKDIKFIEDYISLVCNEALKEKSVLLITEYSERSYIYIGNDNKKNRFTGYRIQ